MEFEEALNLNRKLGGLLVAHTLENNKLERLRETKYQLKTIDEAKAIEDDEARIIAKMDAIKNQAYQILGEVPEVFALNPEWLGALIERYPINVDTEFVQVEIRGRIYQETRFGPPIQIELAAKFTEPIPFQQTEIEFQSFARPSGNLVYITGIAYSHVSNTLYENIAMRRTVTR